MLKRQVLIWMIAILLAAFSALLALGSIAKSSNPQLAILLWPKNGFALAKMAERQMQNAVLQSGGNLPDRFDASIISYAKAALIREPTANLAARILALDHDSRKDSSSAYALMLLSSRLSKRDSVTNLWLGNRRGAEKDVTGLLNYYDITLRTNSMARPLLLQTIADGLSNKEFVVPIARLLASEPPWYDEFWSYAVRTDTAVENVALVRMGLIASGKTQLSDDDRDLMDALIRQKSFVKAEFFYDRMKEAMRTGADTGNHGFDNLPQLPPFDWQLVSKGDYGSAIFPDAGTLEVSSIGRSEGVVAARLVSLTNQNYLLSVTLNNDAAKRNIPVYLTLICAEGKVSENTKLKFELDGGTTEHRFQPITNRCQYYWLNVMVRAEEDGDGFDIAISQVSLVSQ